MKNPSQKSDSNRKISTIIIGAQKAGTTSLKNYLGQHPSIQVHPHKEFSYFYDPEEYQNGFQSALKKYYSDPVESINLLAKNAGLYVSETGISRLKEHNPSCKLIFLMRNPVERTYSSYLMEKNYGAIDEPFESIKDLLNNKNKDDWRYEFFIGMSLYCNHLKNIYKYFPKEQVKLVRYKDFKSNSLEVCKDIFNWMKLDANFVPDTTVKFNVTHVNRSPSYGKFVTQMLNNKNPVKKIMRSVLPGKLDYKVGEMLRNINKTNKFHKHIPEQMSKLLLDFYYPYNQELNKLTGLDFSDWNEKV